MCSSWRVPNTLNKSFLLLFPDTPHFLFFCFLPSFSSHFLFPTQAIMMVMMTTTSTTATCLLIVAPLVLLWAWKLLNWVWLRPKRLERLLRAQGLQGNPYKLLVGDSAEMIKMMKENAKSQQPTSSLSDDKDVSPHVFMFIHHIINKFGTFRSISPAQICNFLFQNWLFSNLIIFRFASLKYN